MSNGVEFEGDDYLAKRQAFQTNFPSGGSASSSKLGQWLIKKGVVNSDKAAQGLLLAVVIFNIIVTFIVIKYFL